jgi:type III restriction enzyme
LGGHPGEDDREGAKGRSAAKGKPWRGRCDWRGAAGETGMAVVCLDDLLWQRPGLLREAYKRAVAAKAIVTAAEEIPPAIESEIELATSRLNVYGCYPPMNGWERAFAEHLDADDTETVLWWHRNEPHKAWAINVLMDNGQPFYPDFIVGIRERPTEDNGLLADPKEAYSRTKELPKLAAEHEAYGKVLILTKENEKERWEIATWDEKGEKPVIAGAFRLSEAKGY